MAVLRKKTTDSTGKIDLVMTYSDENYKLKQEETGLIYGSQCIDTIAGYDEHGVPYSRFTYTETDEPIESETELTFEDTLEMLEEMGVNTGDQ